MPQPPVITMDTLRSGKPTPLDSLAARINADRDKLSTSGTLPEVVKTGAGPQVPNAYRTSAPRRRKGPSSAKAVPGTRHVAAGSSKNRSGIKSAAAKAKKS